MIDSYPKTHCPHGKSLREHCGVCEKLDLVERHQQERVAQLEVQVADLVNALKNAMRNEGKDACLLELGMKECLCWRCQAKAAIARAEGKAQ